MKSKVIPHGKPLQYELPCPHCGSSDGVTLYQHSREPKTYQKCYVCQKIWDVVDEQDEKLSPLKVYEKERMTEQVTATIDLPSFIPGDNYWDRGLTEKTFEAFNVRVSEDDTVMYFPHYDYNGNLVAVKSKKADRKASKPYSWVGDVKRSGLFGINAWDKTGPRRSITVTEGQEDAMAVWQTFGGKYAAVSIINGASSAATGLSTEDIRFLEQFEEIVVCFDSDEPGRKAAKEFARSFSKTKVSVLTLGLKDANEYVKEGRADELRKLWYNEKKPFRPDGLVYSSETGSLISEYDPKPDAHYKYAGLNQILWGIYKPSLIVITAGSGVGKTQFVKDMLLHLHQTTNDRIGCMFLEESVRQSIYQFVSIDLKQNINNPEIYETVGKDEIQGSWKRLFADDRWMFWDHFGSSDIDAVCEQVRFLSVNYQASFVVLDHVSIVVSSQENGDERKALDAIMTRLRKLCEELGICIFLVSHLKRPSGGDSLEEGGVTSLSQLRGSAGIGQLADVVLGLERNGQHTDPDRRNLVTVRVLKSRKTGGTGPAAKLWYCNETSTFTEVDMEREDESLAEIKAERERKKLEGAPIMDAMLGE